MDSKLYYLDKLIGSVFKILPMYESDSSILKSEYIKTLVSDIISSDEILFNGHILEIAVKVNSLTQDINDNHKAVKRVVLDCTNIINKEREWLINDVSRQ